jgi:DNA invertase Pin-like site-specific DNA recombinase
MTLVFPYKTDATAHTNRLTIHILSAIAEEEALMISRRKKDALARLVRD